MIDSLKRGEAKEIVLGSLRNDSEYDDENFVKALQNRQIESPLARYILFNIDLKQQGSARGARFEQVHVEHIFPQKPSDGWDNFECGDVPVDNWKYNIGNQTLLDKQLNQRASNKSFSEKIEYYKEKDGECGQGRPEEGTVFNMTFELHDAYQNGEDEWTTDRILARAQNLAEQATQIW